MGDQKRGEWASNVKFSTRFECNFHVFSTRFECIFPKVVAAQCALLVNMISWVKLVETAFSAYKENKDSIKQACTKTSELLLDLIRLTQTKLDKPTRQKIMCMITLDAHNRDIQEKLVRENVTSPDAFQWQAQLKAKWMEKEDDAQQTIADAHFWYGYEYLGNGPRLVVTPLTDRLENL